MKKSYLLISFALISVLFFSSCKDDEPDEPEIPNEEEVITTLRYTLTPDGGGANVVLNFQDLDGDGGNDPIITVGALAANTTYSGSLELLNETESPTEDITEEILEEAVDHQFFFQTTGITIGIVYSDMDADGAPVGLETLLTTTTAVSDTLTITLRHEPDKTATGVSGGDITNAGGETDIEVTFNVEIQ